MIEAEYLVIVYILVSGVLIAWLFRRLGIADVVGYIVGGIVLTAIADYFGYNIIILLRFAEPLTWIGLALFSFRVGSTIELRHLDLNRVVASELVTYVILWITSGFITALLGLDFVARTVLFLILVNSSSIAIVFLERTALTITPGVRHAAYLQTHIEDLMQFTLFTLLVAGGFATWRPIELLVQVIKVGGTILLLFYVLKILLRFLSKSPLMLLRENKFYTSIAIAILSAFTVTLLGLPPLIGAFIAGLVFALHADLSDIADRLDGLRDVGLLMYFTLLGLRLYMSIKQTNEVHSLLIYGILIGLSAFLFRVLGAFAGSILSGRRIEESLGLALILTPLSEIGLIFINSLLDKGLLVERTACVFTIGIVVSLAVFSTVIPRGLRKLLSLEIKLMPRRIVDYIDTISYEYTSHLTRILSVLAEVIVFTAAILVISYINSFIVQLSKLFNLSSFIVAASAIASSITAFLIFIFTIRGVISKLVTKFAAKESLPLLEKFFDIFMGCLAIMLQVYIFYEFAQTIVEEPLKLMTGAVVLIVISVIIYEIIVNLKRSESINERST